MKIKSDFVTNSSSSSFIVIFPNKVTKLDDVLEYIKPSYIAEAVFDDIKNQEPLEIIDKISEIDMPTAIENILRPYIFNEYDMKDILNEFKDVLKNKFKEIKLPMSVIDIITNVINKKLNEDSYGSSDLDVNELKELLSNNLGGFVYLFEYCDEGGGLEAELEHGGTFNNLKHITISNH